MLLFFFFNDTATTEIYTLSLHDALPILPWRRVLQAERTREFVSRRTNDPTVGRGRCQRPARCKAACGVLRRFACCLRPSDRKSTRLNSSHSQISYAVFCLKKKNHQQYTHLRAPIDHLPHVQRARVFLFASSRLA